MGYRTVIRLTKCVADGGQPRTYRLSYPGAIRSGPPSMPRPATGATGRLDAHQRRQEAEIKVGTYALSLCVDISAATFLGYRTPRRTHTPVCACQRSPIATCRGDAAYRRRADSAGPHLNPSGVGRANCTASFGNCTAASGGLAPLIPIQAGRGKYIHKGMRS